MYVSYPVLLIICFGCMFFGCCAGMVIMALCKVSAACSREKEKKGAL